MYKTSQAAMLPLRLVVFVCFWLGSTIIYAGAGHDHVHDEPALTLTLAAVPRLLLESKQFEVELAGERLQATAKAKGRYHVMLKAELEQGMHPILVTIISKQGDDLLVGKLDIPHHNPNPQLEEKVSPLGLIAHSIHPSWIILMSLLLFFLLGFVLLRDRQKRGAA